ncbi:hypothetical protein VspSTUT16_27060 [Vibrio sp. STUT-A16]|nr:hypothetical protein VspSTUT16_27060 [Vibrio sp. STUT-A16]
MFLRLYRKIGNKRKEREGRIEEDDKFEVVDEMSNELLHPQLYPKSADTKKA